MSKINYSSPSKDQLDTFRTNLVGVASFTALLWDHIDTFADEVEYIWKGRRGPYIYLFFFNRYFTPLSFILNLLAYLSSLWTPEICARFVRYEGITVALAVEVVGVMMLLRIRAIYSNHVWITLFFSFFLLFETGINAWLIAHAGPVIHNPSSDIRACSMVFDSSKLYARVLASSSAWIPLFYDTIIFLLTLNRTIPLFLRHAQTSYIIQRLCEDGLLYYSVIVTVTLVLTIMIVSAPEGIRNIAAQSEQLITVAMMSRITLNLRKASRHRSTVHGLDGDPCSSPSPTNDNHGRHHHKPKHDGYGWRFWEWEWSVGFDREDQTRAQDDESETRIGLDAVPAREESIEFAVRRDSAVSSHHG